MALRLYCADEPLQQLSNILLNGELFNGGEKLNDEVYEALGEFEEELLLR